MLSALWLLCAFATGFRPQRRRATSRAPRAPRKIALAAFRPAAPSHAPRATATAPPHRTHSTQQRTAPLRAQPDDYYDALDEVEAASARLEAARKRLAAAARSAPRPRPRGAKSFLDRSDAGTLLLTVPAAGVTGGALMGGAFSAAWFSAIVPATASMLASGAILGTAFLAPFWMAGGMVLKTTLLDPAKSTRLSIGEYAWELSQSLPGGIKMSDDRGSTEELAGADVAVSVVTNGVPSYVCRLVAGATAWGVGDGLSREELEWIASEINDQLADYSKNREAAGGELPRPLPPRLPS